jgi:hypothetical protein
MIMGPRCQIAPPTPHDHACRLQCPVSSEVLQSRFALADQSLTIWEIWTKVTDEHDSDASCTTVRDYIQARRLARQPGLSPDQLPARK